MAKIDVYRCDTCGGDDVRYDAWYDPNQDDTQVFDDAYCISCDDSCTITKHQEDEESDDEGDDAN